MIKWDKSRVFGQCSRYAKKSNAENPLSRAKIEIFEKVGIIEDEITPLKSTEKIKISSTHYKNHEWKIFPFLFETKQREIKLN